MQADSFDSKLLHKLENNVQSVTSIHYELGVSVERRLLTKEPSRRVEEMRLFAEELEQLTRTSFEYRHQKQQCHNMRPADLLETSKQTRLNGR